MIGRLSLSFLALFLMVGLVGCICMPTRVTEAPLSPQEEERLAATLASVGTWHVVGFEDRRGNPDDDPMGDLIYHFEADGTGYYDQDVMGVSGRNDFDWELEGANLQLHMQRGSRTSTFRVDEFDENGMRWFNYLDSGYFLLEPR